MNKNYNLKLDLQFRCNNSIMKFNQFDNNTSDFFMKISSGGKSFDVEKAIVVLAAIKPSGKVASQFVEVENGLVYADLKPSMKDEIGTYTAKAMLILEDERVVTDSISYKVEEDKIFSLLNDTVETTEEFTLLIDMLNRLSTIETSEEQRMINEAERILSEENRKIEEAKRVEAELVRQHEEADRAKYDATRESNENIRKQNESIRLANETNRIDEEAKRVEEENKRKLAEEERNANYNFMTEDEERRRSEANAHKEAEVLRVQAETNRVNEEAKRRTTEQARVSAENTRVSNENTRKSNEETRQSNETKRVNAETQRQNRYNSFIVEAEANANNFENYTNTAKVKEEERKSNELDRKTQEAKRVSNEVERISNENTRKANEVAREKNETSRQNIFENKVSEVDEKIVELNTTKDNFVSSVNTKVDNKISELDKSKSDMTNTVTNKIDEVENRFNALTSKQQQDAEVIDARDGETSLKARLDRDIEKTNKELDRVKKLEESTVSTVTTESDFTTVEATSNGYFEDVKLEGKTLVNLFDESNFITEDITLNGCSFTRSATGTKYGRISMPLDKLSLLKSKGKYKVVVNITKNTLVEDGGTQKAFYLFSYNYANTAIESSTDGTSSVLFDCGETGVKDCIITLKDFGNPSYPIQNKALYFESSYYATSGELEGQILILECNDDLPQDVNFFKGLKSVGQGADEIVVSSVNSDNTKSDKKRLLYYNNETQAWEKPILREWDSIEKHSDGKYYYHQRSGEVVLNGSENWIYHTSDENYISFMPQPNVNIWGGNQLVVCDKFKSVLWESTILNEYIWSFTSSGGICIAKSKLSTQDVQGFKQWLQANNVTVVYQLAEEKVYECTNIDLLTYANETNYIVESGVIAPRTTLKVHNNISNVVSLLQKKVSLLESDITSYMITQNRLMLASRYNADTVSFKVDVATLRNSFEYDNDLYELILNNILVGKDNYNREYIENLIIFYWMDFVISDEMHSTLFEIIEEQHNPKVLEAPIEE